MTPDDVLRWVKHYRLTHENYPRPNQIAAALEMSDLEVMLALSILENDGLIRTTTSTIILGVN